MKTYKKIILCGFGRAANEILNKLLLEYKQEDIFVFTVNCSKNKEFLKFLNYSKTEYTTDSVNNRFVSGEYLLSIYYPHIIKESVLTAVDYKAINLHPSLLPKYKGCFSAPWVIINGEEETGITYHYIIPEVDAGNILLQKKIKIGDDTGYSLYNKLITIGVEYFDDAFKKLKAGDRGRPQGGEDSLYLRKVPYGGQINLSWPKAKIHRFIRAMYFPPYKGALLKEAGTQVEILDTDSFDEFTGG